MSDDYMEYQIWDTIQALVSTITSTVANQAILKGIGVGDETATLLAATVTWIMRDGAGLIGRILFAYWKGTFLDCNCKRWRLFADVLNDVAIFLDIGSALLPQRAFLPIVCISSVGRSIVGVAGGATRAALTLHQAQRNNMADVSAKDSSQESLSNLIGLILNLVVVSMVTDSPRSIAFIVVILTVLHLYANYRAVRAVCMATFNQSRLHCVVRSWLETGSVLGVQQCNLAEPVWTGLCRFAIRNLTIGCSVTQLSKLMHQQLRYAVSLFHDEGYILLLDESANRCANVCILLKKESGSLEQMKAVFQAEIIDYLLCNKKSPKDFRLSEKEVHGYRGDGSSCLTELLDRSLVCCNNHFVEFINLSREEGWSFDSILLGSDEWRIDNVTE